MKYLQLNAFVSVTLCLTLAGCFGRSATKVEATGSDSMPASITSTPDQTGQTDLAGAAGAGSVAGKQPALAIRPTNARPATGGQQGSDFVLEELNFELKKLSAEVKHLQSQVSELQSKSEVWLNPLSIYSKEIHLSNGSKMYGDILDQDDQNIRIKTLIGVLSIDRSQVVRIVDNTPAKAPETVPESQLAEEFPPPPAHGGVSNVTLSTPTDQSASVSSPSQDLQANPVLSGTVKERKDRSGNTILSGTIKNIGGKRADFIKVNFVFRMNWSGDTKELTAFVKGSHHTFKSGVATDTSLYPGAGGSFELYIPKSFGNFIGYSYSIAWEEYE